MLEVASELVKRTNFPKLATDADANRRAECAFEDPDARSFYDEYHNTIRNFVDEIRADNGGLGLLFDIHGTAQIAHDPADVYLGTLNGEAISSLLSRDPLAGLRGFKGFKIIRS
jgi:hypothetical protein